MPRLNVAIDAQIVPWKNGGVAHALASLIRALGQLQDGAETYRIVVKSGEEVRFWQSVLGANQKLVLKGEYSEKVKKDQRLSGVPRLMQRAFGSVFHYVRSAQRWVDADSMWERPQVPISDGFYESLGCDVLHFPWQHFEICSVPTVFNPHDIQHLHWPQFFPPKEIVWRETIYSAGCHLAQTVIVGSQWAKDDLVQHYHLDPAKVQVIPEGPPTLLSSTPQESVLRLVRGKYKLPNAFIFYPAITWPHKNHTKLLEALAYLRNERNLVVPLVCAGAPHERFWPTIQKRIDDLDLSAQTFWVGFVPEEELQAIFRLAQCLVFPSLFEASSLPIFEAWQEGVPVACSSVTALPGQVLDAALLFDPNSVESMANAIAKLVTEPSLRQDLRKLGSTRVKDFSWDRTARAYRAIYRRAARCPLTEEDHWLLGWDWMREPKRGLAPPGNANCRL